MSHPLNLLLRSIERSARRSYGRKRVHAPLSREGVRHTCMIESTDIEHAVVTRPDPFQTLDWRLSSLKRCCDELDAAIDHIGSAYPQSPAAVGLTRTERTLRALADKTARRHAGLFEDRS